MFIILGHLLGLSLTPENLLRFIATAADTINDVGDTIRLRGVPEVGHRDLRRAEWRTSSHSANGSTCVEVARNLPDIVAVRDSKDRHGPALIFTPDEWRAFLTGLQHPTRGPSQLT